MLTGRISAFEFPEVLHKATKLTVYVGRHERANGRARVRGGRRTAARARGIAGATVLLGLDGTAHGARRRAAFFGRNADVPLMIVSIGEGDRIAAVLDDLGRLPRARSSRSSAFACASATASSSPSRRICRRPTRRASASGRS